MNPARTPPSSPDGSQSFSDSGEDDLSEGEQHSGAAMSQQPNQQNNMARMNYGSQQQFPIVSTPVDLSAPIVTSGTASFAGGMPAAFFGQGGMVSGPNGMPIFFHPSMAGMMAQQNAGMAAQQEENSGGGMNSRGGSSSRSGTPRGGSDHHSEGGGQNRSATSTPQQQQHQAGAAGNHLSNEVLDGGAPALQAMLQSAGAMRGGQFAAALMGQIPAHLLVQQQQIAAQQALMMQQAQQQQLLGATSESSQAKTGASAQHQLQYAGDSSAAFSNQAQQQRMLPTTPATPKDDSEGPKPPKKPLTPYMRFSKGIWAKVKATQQAVSVCETGATIGRMWREMSNEDKEKFNEEFAADKIRYDKEMAEYLKATGLRASDLVKPRGKKSTPAAKRSAAAAATAVHHQPPQQQVHNIQQQAQQQPPPAHQQYQNQAQQQQQMQLQYQMVQQMLQLQQAGMFQGMQMGGQGQGQLQLQQQNGMGGMVFTGGAANHSQASAQGSAGARTDGDLANLSPWMQ